MKVSRGTLRLNRLHLVPDPGVKITIDSRARTVDSSGSVTVELRESAGRWCCGRGRYLDLSDARPGGDIAEFDTRRFDVDVKGFEAVGKVDVEAARGDLA